MKYLNDYELAWKIAKLETNDSKDTIMMNMLAHRILNGMSNLTKDEYLKRREYLENKLNEFQSK
jgi:hypothetical protein